MQEQDLVEEIERRRMINIRKLEGDTTVRAIPEYVKHRLMGELSAYDRLLKYIAGQDVKNPRQMELDIV